MVRATKAEKQGGKGCRIFLHPSVAGTKLTEIRKRVETLDISNPNPDGPVELNYLFPQEPDEMAIDQDWRLLQGLTKLYKSLDKEVSDDVRRQYEDSFAALNRMREQLDRPETKRPLC